MDRLHEIEVFIAVAGPSIGGWYALNLALKHPEIFWWALSLSGRFHMDQFLDGFWSDELYFHLPFCETLCWFCGCTTVISGDHSRADRYLDYLEKELDLTTPLIDGERRAVRLHFGGGTPNFFSPAQIDRLSALIHDRFKFEIGAEISVELDPRRLTREHIDTSPFSRRYSTSASRPFAASASASWCLRARSPRPSRKLRSSFC